MVDGRRLKLCLQTTEYCPFSLLIGLDFSRNWMIIGLDFSNFGAVIGLDFSKNLFYVSINHVCMMGV